MFFQIIVGLASILIIYKFLRAWYLSNIKLPNKLKRLPCVKALPILGIVPLMTSPLCHYLFELKEKYGNIFTINFGMRNIIVLNDYQMIKKTLKDESENFSGRWKTALKISLSEDSGILFIDGETYYKQKSFLMKVLRDFGFGKSRSHDIIQSESKYLIKELDFLEGKSVNFSTLISIYTANIISLFIMNKRFERNDPKIKYIEYAIFETTKKRNIIDFLYLMFPILDNMVIVSKLILQITSRLRIFTKVKVMFMEEILEHRSILDYNSDGNDLMDRFLIEQRRLIEKNRSPETFTDIQLVFLAFELFGAGYETTSNSLVWSMLFMSKHPNIQNRIHEEIIQNIGEERIPTMKDKISLNYTQAVIDEIFRLSSIVPLGLFHRTFKNTSVNEFFISKNSLVFTNLYACHRDPKIWTKPSEFYPEHFLIHSENGELKYSPREELIPFGIGKRQCIGESLARMEFFIFFTSILQKFRVSFRDSVSEDQYQDALRGNEGMIRFSNIDDFIFKKY